MKLEALPIPETQVGVQKIQNQLAALHLEIQTLQKEKEKDVRARVWCTRCKSEGNHKDHFPIYNNYLEVGGPTTIKNRVGPSEVPKLWCAIFQGNGLHMTDFCPRLGKYILELQQPYCKFF